MLETIGKYPIEEELGRGAMGVVYLASDPIIGRRVAIKTTPIPDTQDPEIQEQLDRFRREAQAAGRLNHPNIVTVYDYGETEQLCYLVMEYVQGHSLADAMARGDLFSLRETLDIVRDILLALEHAHEQGVVHRDIKPASIMLSERGAIKITDFGIARIESSTLTQSGTLLGTPGYMSPEQFTADTIDRRTDLYSTGVLLYELLTSDKAFTGSLSAVMQKILQQDLPPPSTLNPRVPPLLDSIVRLATEKDREARFCSAAEFAEALREVRNNLEPAADDSAQPRHQAGGDADGLDTTIAFKADASNEPTRRMDAEPVPPRAGDSSRATALISLPMLLLAALGALWIFSQSTMRTAPETASPAPTVIPAKPAPESPTAAASPPPPPEQAAESPPREPSPAAAETPPRAPAQPRSAPDAVDQTQPLLLLTSNKGKLPEFTPGEELVVYLTAGQDALTYCYYEQHDGRVFRIFPNRFRNDPMLPAGLELHIPDQSMKFSFTFERPGAIELVHCFATAEPFLQPLPEELLRSDLIPLETQGIGAIKAAFQQAGGDHLIETALLIQVK